MNRDQIIQWAREAWGRDTDIWLTHEQAFLFRFAAAVRAAALEQAAQMCEGRAGTVSMFATGREASANNHAVRDCAAAIRSLASEGESNA